MRQHIKRRANANATAKGNTRSLFVETALHTVMLAFNLMSLFRQVLLQQSLRKDGTDMPMQHTLVKLCHQRFAQPAFATHRGRRPLLKLATAIQKREWISGLGSIQKVRSTLAFRHPIYTLLFPNEKSGLIAILVTLYRPR